MLSATVAAVAILLLLFPESATQALNQWTGNSSWSGASRAATIRALTLLLIIVLIFALDPEVRAFLIFVDYVGIDIFLMLLFFQGRDILHWFSVAAALSAARRLADWGWYPMPLPYRSLFNQHPWWGLYATAQPAALAFIVVGIAFTLVRLMVLHIV
jgi:hypothetical protein